MKKYIFSPLNVKNSLYYKFPSLSEKIVLQYLSFSVLYVAQGIPKDPVIFGIAAWLTINGKRQAEIDSFTLMDKQE